MFRVKKKFDPEGDKILQPLPKKRTTSYWVSDVIYKNRIFSGVRFVKGANKHYVIDDVDRKAIVDRLERIKEKDKTTLGDENRVVVARIDLHKLDSSFHLDQFRFYKNNDDILNRLFGQEVAKKLIYTSVKASVNPNTTELARKEYTISSSIQERITTKLKALEQQGFTRQDERVTKKTEIIPPKPVSLLTGTHIERESYVPCFTGYEEEDTLRPVGRISTSVTVAVRN